ncbi:hypothetical protein [Halorhabdus amylolytica]|uniref:hypothetical protein n=1 Tax=Halorhabdus amylolytica TaxID=2559573 RepID=UPI0010AAB5BC|nr:hypothetical protein [Halorhabdus amylolytica]
MSTLDRTFPDEHSTSHLIALGAVLIVASLGVAGWLLSTGDIPGGLSTLLLTVAGGLFVAIGNAEDSRASA